MHECSPALPFIASVTLVKLRSLSKPQFALLKMGMMLPTQRYHENVTRVVPSLLPELGMCQMLHDGKYRQNFPSVHGNELNACLAPLPNLQLVPIK